MQIKLFVSAAAIALVAGLGSASAGDQYSTLEGIAAQAMTPQEMGAVVGAHVLIVTPPANIHAFGKAGGAAGGVSPPVSPSGRGRATGGALETIFINSVVTFIPRP